VVISLRKCIEQYGDDCLNAALASYGSALSAMGNSGEQACPPLGAAMRQNLRNLQAALAAEPTPSILEETGQRVETELKRWGCSAADYFKQRAQEVKELMMILARTAEVIGERDQRYLKQFHEFTGRLQSMADLHDLVQIRDSLVRSAIDLKACAEAMAEESRKSTARLREEVHVYQARLDDAERLAGSDPLTGLDNRRRVECAVERRIAQSRLFSILILDLNGFKDINDAYGHLTGDEVLKQFASELKSAFRATDVVGRWGGDEFIVVLDEGPEETSAIMERITRWLFGRYTIRANGSTHKVTVDAAVGIATWQPGDTLRSLLERGDTAMYRSKRTLARARA
jgi:diguanylate cyclase (GGDEF)-like protein